jgi:hypothetical protein
MIVLVGKLAMIVKWFWPQKKDVSNSNKFYQLNFDKEIFTSPQN